MKNPPKLSNTLSEMLITGVTSNYYKILPVFAKYFEDKRQANFDDFVKQLLKGTAKKEDIEYEKMIKITEDQLYALLNATIEDEEREKASIYANVYRSILEGKIEKDKYSRIIRLSKDLPLSAINLIKDLSNMLDTDYSHHESDFYKTTNLQDNRYEINLLIQHNVFINDETELTNVIRIKPTKIYNLVKNSFFYN